MIISYSDEEDIIFMVGSIEIITTNARRQQTEKETPLACNYVLLLCRNHGILGEVIR